MAYKRKTYDEYEIQANYGFGWERETTEETYENAKRQIRCYRENVSYPVRIVKKRVPIGKEN